MATSKHPTPPGLVDLEEGLDELSDLAPAPPATPPETPPVSPPAPMTPPLPRSSRGSEPNIPGAAGDLHDLIDKRITAMLGLVQTSNERLETREGVFAELCQLLRETIADTLTTMKLWERLIGQLDDLEDGLSQSTAALVKVHQELMQALSKQR